MPDDNRTGVENEGSVAGGLEFTKEDFPYEPGEGEVIPASQEEEVTEEETEAQAEETQETQETQVDPVAFAKRLKGEREKIREEERQKLLEEMRQTYPEQPYTQQGHPQQPQVQGIPPLPDAEAERLADQYGTTPEVVRGMYMQQALINRQTEAITRIAYENQEKEEKAQARAYAEEVRKNNPAAPEWDENRLTEFRKDYFKKYGVALNWRDTYRQVVADEALSGKKLKEVVRTTQQETINKITSRDKETVQIKGRTAKKPTVEDLSDEEFERFLEEAEEGKYV